MASDIMQQVQEDSRKKKQQGVLSRLSSTAPRSAGVGGYGTPEPTVVEKAKEVQEEEVVAEPEYKQSAKRLAADLREDGTTTESWEAAKQEVADRGARYREALQSPKGDQTPTEMEVSYDKEKEFQTQDYGDAGILRSEKISQYDLIEDDETGLPSKTYREALVRNAKQMDIPNLDKFLSIMDAYEKSAGLQKAAKTKTELTIARDTAEDATKQLRQLFPNIGNLEDAAIKDSIIKSNIVDRDAAETFFPETRGTGFSMDGSDVEDAVSRIKKQREDAQKRLDAQNQKVVKGAVEKAKETGPGGAGTRRQPTDAEQAARKALASLQSMPSEELADRLKPAEITSPTDTVDYSRPSEQEDAEFSPLLDEVVEEKSTEDVLQDVPEGEERSEALARRAADLEMQFAEQEDAVIVAKKRVEDLFEAYQTLEDAPKIKANIERAIEYQQEIFKRAEKKRDVAAMERAAQSLKSAELKLKGSTDERGNRIPGLTEQITTAQSLIDRLDPDRSITFSPSEMRSGRIDLDRLQQVIRKAAAENKPDESPVEDLIASAAGEQEG